MTSRIGLVGLGLVGTAIAESLLAREFDVVGFDISPERCQQAARYEHSPPGRRRPRPCRGNPAWLPRGQARGPAPTQIHHRHHDRRPRGNNVAGATARRTGNHISRFDHLRLNIFSALAEKVFYVGPSGSGSKAKLSSNLILGLNRLALAEGLVFAEKLGLDLEAFLELLKATPAYSAIMDTKGEKMLKGDFAPQARVRQHHKDVALILKYAQKAGQELPLSNVHLDVLEKAIAAGDADLDNSAIIKEIRRRTAPPK
ncbi:MAG: NAD(P)-dependent oxidoreductase [Planctomycetota bacterium]